MKQLGHYINYGIRYGFVVGLCFGFLSTPYQIVTQTSANTATTEEVLPVKYVSMLGKNVASCVLFAIIVAIVTYALQRKMQSK